MIEYIKYFGNNSGWILEKLVVKTAVKTVLIILGILVAVFAVFNFAFPQHMATATEGIGNYELAVKYASLRYYYTKDCGDLARCFDDSVLLGKDEYVLQYGEELVNHKDYAEICRQRNSSQTGSMYDYGHWVNSKLAVSYYNQGKASKAIELAVADNGADSFEYGNAMMSLAAQIKSANDAEAAGVLLGELEKINPADNKEKDYLTQVIDIMRNVAGQ